MRNPESFLYNTGQIKEITDTTWNRPQFYTLTRTENGTTKTLGTKLAVPPVNVGKRSTPDYAHLADQAVHTIGGRKVFAGQRADAFHVDLGSVFDLGGLRPFNQAHLIPLAKMDGINSVQSFNVHTIAIQVPISEVTRKGNMPTDVMSRGLGDRCVVDGAPSYLPDPRHVQGQVRRDTESCVRSPGSATRCSTR